MNRIALALVLSIAAGCGDSESANCPDGGSTDGGADVPPEAGGEVQAHAGAIDDKAFTGSSPQTPRPPYVPRIPDELRAECNCTCSTPDGTAWLDLPAGPPACVPQDYRTTVTCVGGTLDTILWEKTGDRDATYGDQYSRSAPYRWCDDNGTNSLDGRAPFGCMRSGNGSTLSAPMCSPGKFDICATPIFRCGGQKYRGASACKTVIVTKP